MQMQDADADADADVMWVWMHAYMPLVPAQVRERNRILARGMARGVVAPFFGDEYEEEHAAAKAAAEAEELRHGEAKEGAEKVVRWSGSGEHACVRACVRACACACACGGAVAVGVCVAPGSLRAPEGARESTPRPLPGAAMAGAAAGSLGRKARLAAEKFGVQGEGALEGGYGHYRMRAQHQHDFRFSRFNCSDAPFEFAPPHKRGAPPSRVPPVETQSVVVRVGRSGDGVVDD